MGDENEQVADDGEDGQSEAFIEAQGIFIRALDFCHEHGLDPHEVFDSVEQAWMP